MNEPKVSIIVPTYNVREYLEKCLTSLVNQTLKDIEIIVVLDCPTDGSDKIAEAFAATDNRIKLIYNPQNLHLGFTRNQGMAQATGKYIGFCDADDYCSPTMYELLYQKAESEDLDMVHCNFIRQSGEDISNKSAYPKSSSSEELQRKTIEGLIKHKYKVPGFAWNRILRTNFINQHHLVFEDTKIINSEDAIFCIQAYLHTTKTGEVPDCLYYYVQHPASLVNEANGYMSLPRGIAHLECMYAILDQMQLVSRYEAMFAEGVARRLYALCRTTFMQLSFKKIRVQRQTIYQSKLMVDYLNYLFQFKHLPVLCRLKPTVIVFLLFVKLLK